MTQFVCCPIEVALQHIGKKWAINIIRDLFGTKKRFNEFLKANPKLSTKMLSARLKELEKESIIEKKVVSISPLIVEYGLTKKGEDLNKVLYEMAMYSFRQYGNEVFYSNEKAKLADINNMKKIYKVK